MSFDFTVLSDDRFIEILQAWVDSPWPKTAEDGYALRDRFGWTQKEAKPNVFTSDVHPIGFPCGVVRKLLTVCLCGFCPGRLV